MRSYSWALMAVCLTAFEFLVVFARSGPITMDNHPLLLALIVTAFSASGIGGWWMLYKIVRHEKEIFPMILAVLMRNSFLWYYFEVVVPRREGRA